MIKQGLNDSIKTMTDGTTDKDHLEFNLTILNLKIVNLDMLHSERLQKLLLISYGTFSAELFTVSPKFARVATHLEWSVQK